MARKFILIPVLLILLGLAGLGMTACGAVFTVAGLMDSATGQGGAQQYGPALAMAGAIMGLLPGLIALGVTRWGWRRYHAPESPPTETTDRESGAAEAIAEHSAPSEDSPPR